MNTKKKQKEELFEQYCFACMQGELEFLKSFYAKLKPTKLDKFLAFLKLGQSTRKDDRLSRLEREGFYAACDYGHYDIVKFYLETEKIKYEDTNVLTVGCFNAIGSGHINIFNYLAPHAESDFLSANYALERLCLKGDLPAIKHMFNNPFIKVEQQIINIPYDEFHTSCSAFMKACEMDHLDIVKYLMDSPELEITVDLDAISEYFSVSEEILHYFILERRIEKNNNLMQYVICDDLAYIDKLYEKKELQENLDWELSHKKEVKKKHKI